MKSVTLREILRWAFVEELTKGGGEGGLASPRSAWGAILGLEQLGCIVRSGYRDPGAEEFVERFEPHVDALAVGEAARQVCGGDESLLAALVRYGVLGARDEWPADPRRVPVLRDGREVWLVAVSETINGRAYQTERLAVRKGRKWEAGAYQLMGWDVDPAIVDRRRDAYIRLEAALGRMAGMLAGVLVAHRLVDDPSTAFMETVSAAPQENA